MRRVHTGVNDRILSYYTKFRRVILNDLEFHGSHSSTNKESVAMSDRFFRIVNVNKTRKSYLKGNMASMVLQRDLGVLGSCGRLVLARVRI